MKLKWVGLMLGLGFGLLDCDERTTKPPKDDAASSNGMGEGDTGAVAEPVAGNFSAVSCDDEDGACIQVPENDADAFLSVFNGLGNDTTVILPEGTFSLDNQVTIRGVSGARLIGQGMDSSVLDFSAQMIQTNGVDAVSDDFLIQDLTIADATKD